MEYFIIFIAAAGAMGVVFAPIAALFIWLGERDLKK